MKIKYVYILLISLIILISRNGYSQSFLNGDFEINTSSACNYNMGNATFTSTMSNCDGYGGGGELDIMGPGASCPYGTAPSGNWFIGVACPGGVTDAFTMTLSAPLVAGNSYTIQFWDKGDGTYPPSMPVVIGLSTVPAAAGTVVYTGPTPTLDIWNMRCFTFVAPNNGMYISVSAAGPTRWSHVDNFSFVSSTCGVLNTITTGLISGSPFCPCTTVNVPFTSVGSFTLGNVYTAELSDATGSFAAPTAIGTLVDTVNAGTIACTIPCTTTPGTLYRIRVTSTLPVVVGTDNGVDIIVGAVVTPSVSITALPVGALCTGASVTFTATPTNGGTLPTYQWAVNGVNIAGATAATYTSSTLINGDNVSVTMTSNDPCASPLTATSSTVVVMNPPVTPSVSITALPVSPICVGTAVTFTAVPINGGATPTYQWQVNGVNIAGATLATYTSSSLTNSDVVSVIMTSGLTCVTSPTATSNLIPMVVNPIPTVTLTAPGICAGQTATLTASGAATYTWSAGATPLAANTATANPLTTTTYTVTGSSSGCSNTATVTVSVGSLTTLSATGATICSGDAAVLTATGATTYVWSTGATSTGTNTATASPVTTTTYTVTGNDLGCIGTATATVIVTPTPIANFTAPFTTSILNPTVTFSDHSINAQTWNWNFGDLSSSQNTSTVESPSHTYSQEGEYCVKLIVNNNVCVDSAERCIMIIPEYIFYIPNAFSPNGDGTNDDFYGTGQDFIKYEMRIFNRWGELLFYTDDKLKHWDGTHGGGVVKEDVYIYLFNITDKQNQQHKYIGNVNLVK